MNLVKYLVPLWVGIVIYTLFSLLKGPISASSYTQLQAEQEKLQANMEALKLINKELEITKDALMYDKDAIAVYARDLGYRSSRERFVRIVGFEGTKKQRIEPGQLVTAVEPEYITDNAIKICAFCIAIGAFLCILIPDILQRRANQQKKRKPRNGYTRYREEPRKAAS
ncbi:MAG: septum formation initiator family protein [Treponema sp.]|jgi:cell division protein FtsB|nr:septum formation initiator family protein [Treponema sp.]